MAKSLGFLAAAAVALATASTASASSQDASCLVVKKSMAEHRIACSLTDPGRFIMAGWATKPIIYSWQLACKGRKPFSWTRRTNRNFRVAITHKATPRAYALMRRMARRCVINVSWKPQQRGVRWDFHVTYAVIP